jgi:hypothetical protein
MLRQGAAMQSAARARARPIRAQRVGGGGRGGRSAKGLTGICTHISRHASRVAPAAAAPGGVGPWGADSDSGGWGGGGRGVSDAIRRSARGGKLE